MPTTINASNTSGGAVVTGDGSGILELQSGGVTGITVNGANVTVAGTLTATGGIPASSLTGTLGVANGGTGAATLTGYVKGSGTSAFTASATIPTSDLTGTLGVANGGTGAATLAANNVLIGNGTSAVSAVAPGTAGNVLTSNGTTWASTALPSNAVAYPQNIRSANYTLVIGDAGKQIFHPVADTTVRTYTIPANASVAFPIGTVVLFTVENGGTAVNIAITSDTLVYGDGTTGTIAVAPNNTLMAIKVTATKWMANYLYQTGAPVSTTTLAVSHSSSPFVTVYPWFSTGFGAKYTNPATLPISGSSIALTFTGKAIAVGQNSTPFITAYSWSANGFGVKYANPATTPPANCVGVAFNPAGTSIAVTCSSNQPDQLTGYPWSASTGFGTRYANPSVAPGSTNMPGGIAFSPSGDTVAVANDSIPFVVAYTFNSGSGFGTRYADPAAYPPGVAYGVAFNPAGTAIAVAHNNSPYVHAWPWSAGSGFGTKFTNPATLPGGNGTSVTFSPAGDAIAIGHAQTPYITVYPWSGAGFGTKYTNPATLPTTGANAVTSVAFSPAGDAIAVTAGTTPFITAYPWSVGGGFGTKYADPATLPTGSGSGVAFSLTS